jgi:CRISPR-associated endoribonuclease Cas6
MRAQLEIKFNKTLVLPIHYNYALQALILKWLNDQNYSNFIHDTGYQFNNRKFKLYTFSRLEGKYQLNREQGIITFFDKVNLIISTADDKFLVYVVNTVIGNESFNLLGNEVYIESVKCYNAELKDSARIITKSPIVAYSTFEKDGRKKTHYYNPFEREFGELIQKNLIKKFRAFYGKYPNDDRFNIIPIKNKWLKQNLVKYKDFVIVGWSGQFLVEGSQELLQLAYDAGACPKSSMGFGCIEIIGKG